MAYTSSPQLDPYSFGMASQPQIDPSAVTATYVPGFDFENNTDVGVAATAYFEFGKNKADGTQWSDASSSLASLVGSLSVANENTPTFTNFALVVPGAGMRILNIFPSGTEPAALSVVVGLQFKTDKYEPICGTGGSADSIGTQINQSPTLGVNAQARPSTGISMQNPSPNLAAGDFVFASSSRAATTFSAQMSIGPETAQTGISPALRASSAYYLGSSRYTAGSYMGATPSICALAIFAGTTLTKGQRDAVTNVMYRRQLARKLLCI